nr:ribonuclease H-like domain-containing protein [Tanacetum cinerariifolium]
MLEDFFPPVFISSASFGNQAKHAVEIIEWARMLNYNPCKTPIDTESKLRPDGDPVEDPTLFCCLLIAYVDADWAGFPSTRSTSGYCVFLGDNLITWSSKCQHVISRSSVEAKYHGGANAVVETAWVRNLLRELLVPLRSTTLVYGESMTAVNLSSNSVQHQHTKNIKIDVHFVSDLVSTSRVRVLYVPLRYQYEDIFTKGLPSLLFIEFRSSLSVLPSLAQTVGAY